MSGGVTIKVRKDGPLLVRGPVTLIDHEGRPFPVEGDDVAPCRCGGSTRRPFCDGSHRQAVFDGTCLRQDDGQEDRRDDAVSP